MQIESRQSAIDAAIKYNPHLWGVDELRAIFVVRRTDLADLLARVEASSPREVPQHILICGHRGMGKSTLLRRLALAIKETPAVATQWLPLNFPEEQYTVRTLSELLLNVLDALADTLEQTGTADEALAALDDEIRRISTLSAASAEAAAIAFLEQWVTKHGRGLVLLVDSSDQLLGSLASGEGRTEASTGGASALWRLRKILSHQPGLFWIGASYRALEADHQYQDAFHDFFALHELRPLDLDELRKALLALARQFGAGRALKGEEAEAEMARLLDSRPERLKTLRLLSGGNPRTMVTLYELFAAGGDDSIQSDLNRLLDTMTPVYKARMEALSEQPRKILAHIMEGWHPVGVRELAEESGIAATTISGQLTRLEAEGLIEKASLPGGAKRSGFQVCERFFNVWYLMRYGTRRLRQRLTWAVQFMRLWFSRDDLASIAEKRGHFHVEGRLNDAGNLEFSRAIAAALGDDDPQGALLEWNVLAAAHRESCRVGRAIREILPETLFDLKGSDCAFRDAADYLKRFAALDEPLSRCPHVAPNEREAWIREVKGAISLTLANKERLAQAVADPTFLKFQCDQIRDVLQHERQTYQRQFSVYHADAEDIYRMTSEGRLFPDFPDPRLGFLQLETEFGQRPGEYRFLADLFLLKHQDEWAERVLCKAIVLNPDDSWLFTVLGYLLQDHLKRYEDAEAAYRQAIRLDEKSALPWNGLGNLLQDHLKRYEDAEDAYRQAIRLDEKSALPWNGLGNLLQDHLKRYEDAEDAYRQAIRLDEKYALPWNGLGVLLQGRLKRYEEAEAAYRQAIRLDEKHAMPWNNLGNLLKDHLKCYDEAEAAYRQAIGLDEKYASPWNGLGNLLQDHLKRYDDAEAAYRQAMAISGGDAYCVANLARLKALRRQREAASELYRQVALLATADRHNLVLQANLWLGNRDSALTALNTLAADASQGDVLAFGWLREQCWECGAIGMGEALADLMSASPWADFLTPFALALRAAASGEVLSGAAPEVLSLASEILAEIRVRGE